jgi:cell wall-associated NlpC family hydrolase
MSLIRRRTATKLPLADVAGEARVAAVVGVTDVIFRRGALARLLGVGAAASLALGAWSAVAGATTFTTGAAQAKVTQTQAQISQIETTILQENHQSAVLGQEYDAQMGKLQAERAALTATNARLAHVRKTIVVDKRVLAKAAVQAYVLGEQGTQITTMFATSANTAVISEEYSQTAVGNLSTAKHVLEGAQARLATVEQQQQSQAQQTETAAQKLQLLELENQKVAQQSQATLTSLKGSLGQQVLAAAAAKVKKEQEAAAAAAAAKQQAAAAAAAAAAAQQAQLASELSTTTQVIQTVTQEANQANASAGGPTVASGAPSAPAPSAPAPSAPAPSAPAPNAPSPGSGGTAGAQGLAAVHAAESQLGVPYVWGGESPGSGFDCSGLTQWSWGQAGVSIPRTSQQQYATVPHVSLTSLQPGDLLFFLNLDGTGTIDHVAMYVGSGPYGSQTIIQAPYTGATVSYAPLFTNGLVAAGLP